VTAANGSTGTISLEAVVTGTPTMAMSTADQRLDAKGRRTSSSGSVDHRQHRHRSARGGELAGTAPTGWDVVVRSGDDRLGEAQRDRPGDRHRSSRPRSVAGDTRFAVRASAGSQSSNLDLRYTLEGSRTLGFIAIIVIIRGRRARRVFVGSAGGDG
jgi:hypothetical protein